MAIGDEITFFPLSGRVRIHLLDEPVLKLPDAIEEEVEAIWQEQSETKYLFNSNIFSLVSHDENRLFGRFVQYRYFVAAQENPKLRDILQVFPLGVSGISLSDNHILIGTRDVSMSIYGGFLECVPSGTIPARAYSHGEVDFIMQLIWELEEEAHIHEKRVKEIHPLGLFYTKDKGIYDIGMHVQLDMKEYEKNLDGSREYPLLQWLTFPEWEQRLLQPDLKIVPLSRALWHNYKTVHKK